MSEPLLRPPREDETRAVAELLLESSPDLYARYASGRERALGLLERALAEPGTSASADVVTVAELDGRPVGALAGFAVSESFGRARSFLRLTYRTLPVWTWPAALRIYRLGSRQVPPPPPRSWYVDSLAVAAEARRRGVARALLVDAERRGRELDLEALALETEVGNTGAQALYEGFGMEAVRSGEPAKGLPGFVSYVKPL